MMSMKNKKVVERTALTDKDIEEHMTRFFPYTKASSPVTAFVKAEHAQLRRRFKKTFGGD